MQTILVTGCAGFIGSHVCEQLLDLGYKVIGIDKFDDFNSREIKEKNLSIFKERDRFLFLGSISRAILNDLARPLKHDSIM